MGKFAKGNNKGAKLTNEQVFELRRLYFEEDWNQARLARHYGVNINTVGRIVRGETRQNVPMPDDSDAAYRLLQEQARIDAELVAKLQKDIQVQQAKPNPSRDLADWEAASRYGVKRD